jgi:hypothetical protein
MTIFGCMIEFVKLKAKCFTLKFFLEFFLAYLDDLYCL